MGYYSICYSSLQPGDKSSSKSWNSRKRLRHSVVVAVGLGGQSDLSDNSVPCMEDLGSEMNDSISQPCPAKLREHTTVQCPSCVWWVDVYMLIHVYINQIYVQMVPVWLRSGSNTTQGGLCTPLHSSSPLTPEDWLLATDPQPMLRLQPPPPPLHCNHAPPTTTHLCTVLF